MIKEIRRNYVVDEIAYNDAKQKQTNYCIDDIYELLDDNTSVSLLAKMNRYAIRYIQYQSINNSNDDIIVRQVINVLYTYNELSDDDIQEFIFSCTESEYDTRYYELDTIVLNK